MKKCIAGLVSLCVAGIVYWYIAEHDTNTLVQAENQIYIK